MSNLDNSRFNAEKYRSDFPILSKTMNGKPLVYLDNAATTQKPQVVIDAVSDLYSNYYSNIHRSVYLFSQLTTQMYDDARTTVAKYLNARRREEIIFTGGATDSLNMLSSSWGRANLKQGDEIIVSEMEHHANIVPWQQIALEKGAVLRVIPMDSNGVLLLDEYRKLLSERTKIVSVVHISNSLGTINPINEIIKMAKEVGALTCIDASQSVQHSKIDLTALDCDFLVFSGHKIYAPTGIGVLYGKYELLQNMQPYKTGGDMIKSVSFERTIFADVPERFEAGTQNIAGAIGLAAAINYLNQIGLDRILQYEKELFGYASGRILEIPQLNLIGNSPEKAGIISFLLEDIHPHDIGTILDKEGVAVRTGQHCTEPVMRHFGIPATARASLAFYNTREDINVLIESIKKVIDIFE